MVRTEADRLKAVDRFLDLELTKKEELQDIVALVAKLFGTTTALITLIDKDTQFIKIKQAFDLDTTARKDAICNLVINDSEVLIIPDILADNRFINHPVLKNDSGVRFYAGAPLTTHDGFNLGSLCTFDTVPHTLIKTQQKMLHILSRQVIQLLEFDAGQAILKEQLQQAKNEEIKMRSFFDSSACNYLLLDKEYRVVAFNKAIKKFIQLSCGLTITVGMDATLFVNEEYMADFISGCKKALAGETQRHEHLLKFRDMVVFCDITCSPAHNDDGEIIGVFYNSIDITQRIRNQEDLVKRQSILDQIAYIQSHELRKPVANIKGLLLLLEMDDYYDAIPELKEMQQAVDKLDNTISVIVNYTGKSLNKINT